MMPRIGRYRLPFPLSERGRRFFGSGESVAAPLRSVAAHWCSATMSLNLPKSEELVIEDAELRSILAKIPKRSAGGRAVSGRYNKHDTARLRFIRSIALPGIRFGQLVPDDDMRMLRLGPTNVLQGVDCSVWLQHRPQRTRRRTADGSRTAQIASHGRLTACRSRLMSYPDWADDRRASLFLRRGALCMLACVVQGILCA